MYLMWYDDHPKHTLAHKIADACEVYQARFGVAPNVVLVSASEANIPADALIRVVPSATVQKNAIWVGREE